MKNQNFAMIEKYMEFKCINDQIKKFVEKNVLDVGSDDKENKEIYFVIPMNTNIFKEEEILHSNLANLEKNNLTKILDGNFKKNKNEDLNVKSSTSTANNLQQYENKKRNHLDMMNTSSASNKTENEISAQNMPNNKKFKYAGKSNNTLVIDPGKKFFQNWSVEKLEEELEKINKNYEDLEIANNSEEKKKKELENFVKLSKKWLKISQEAIYTMLEIHPQDQNYKRNTIKSILDHFKIPSDQIDYDSENECFK